MFKGTMKEMLDQFDSFEWNRGLYVAKLPLTFNTECIVIDDLDEEIIFDGKHDKIILENEEYIDFLRIQDIMQIFNNMKAQGVEPSDELKLKAILYYYETDRFLEVSPQN